MKNLKLKSLVAVAFCASSLSFGTAVSASDIPSLDGKSLEPQQWEWLCRQIPITCKEH